MLRRVSSSLFQRFVRPTSTSDASFRQSFDASSLQPDSKPDQIECAADETQASLDTTGSASETSERDAFVQTLAIRHPADTGDESTVELPYEFEGGLIITSEGVLHAPITIGLAGDQLNFHTGLRSLPSVALTVTRLELIIPKVAESDQAAGDEILATQQEGLLEWARTVPALKNLTSFKLWTEGDASDDATKSLNISTLMKSLAWLLVPHQKLIALELGGVDLSEDAARIWEGAAVETLRLEGCPTRVSAIIPRLPCLREVTVAERGAASEGCDYVGLLSHVNSKLETISITLRDSWINVDEFVATFGGISPLKSITCPFSSPSLSPADIESKLQEAFPRYNESLSTQPGSGRDSRISQTEIQVPRAVAEFDSDEACMDVELGVLSSSTNHNKAGTTSRSSTLDRKKEELKTAEAAKKEKGRIGATIRKLKAVARGER